MIGIDITQIDRIETMIQKFGQKALNRFLTKEEQTLAKTPQSYAGFWALKEATSKALGCGIGKECGFFDIRIYKTPQGAPKIALKQKLIEKYNITSIECSITHDAGIAVGVVILQTQTPTPPKGF